MKVFISVLETNIVPNFNQTQCKTLLQTGNLKEQIYTSHPTHKLCLHRLGLLVPFEWTAIHGSP